MSGGKVEKYVSTSSHGGMVAVVSNDYSRTYVAYPDYAAAIARAEAAERDAWISVEDRRPVRNEPAIYWHRGEFGGCGYIAIADEWRDEHHLPFATHWKLATPPASASAQEAEPERYVCLKATGSRYAYVNDTQEGKTVKRYDISRRYGGMDGWTCATEHANSLNAIAAQQAEGE